MSGRIRRNSCRSPFFRDQTVELLDFFDIAVEQLEEASLRPGSSFGAQQLHGAEHVVEVFEIHQQILQPESGALAYRSGLCRLEMRKTERRQRLVFICEGGEV